MVGALSTTVPNCPIGANALKQHSNSEGVTYYEHQESNTVYEDGRATRNTFSLLADIGTRAL